MFTFTKSFFLWVISLELGKGLVNPFLKKPWFFPSLQNNSFENTVGKGEIAHNIASLGVFYPFG